MLFQKRQQFPSHTNQDVSSLFIAFAFSCYFIISYGIMKIKHLKELFCNTTFHQLKHPELI